MEPNGPKLQLIDMVFPGDCNHHGTLFGGAALSHMDKIAFLAATRHGRAPFVTACSGKIDFIAPAHRGEMIEATARITRVGRSSVDVEVELVAEVPVSGERRRCTSGTFTLVAIKGEQTRLPLPRLCHSGDPDSDDGADAAALRVVDIVFPSQTNHYGTLYGGDALKMMGKAAFITATRWSRAVMVMAASDRIDFASAIREGEMVELVTRRGPAGRRSLVVEVELWAEDLLSGERRHAASAAFTMVAVESADAGATIDLRDR